jgi:hypothetical protein
MVNSVAAKLDLPKILRIHNVFHIRLLRHYTDSPNGCKAVPLPTVIDGELEYEVEAILDDKLLNKQKWYLVKWKGFPTEDNTWEPSYNLTNCSTLLQQYHKCKTAYTLART